MRASCFSRAAVSLGVSVPVSMPSAIRRCWTGLALVDVLRVLGGECGRREGDEHDGRDGYAKSIHVFLPHRIRRVDFVRPSELIGVKTLFRRHLDKFVRGPRGCARARVLFQP